MFESILKLYRENKLQQILQININPSEDHRVTELYAISALKQRQFKIASENFKFLVDNFPAESHFYHLGLCYLNLLDYESAINNFLHNSSRVNQFSLPSQVNLAHCYKSCGEIKKAIEILETINRQHPEVSQAWFMLHEIFRKEDYKENLEKLINSTPFVLQSSTEVGLSKAYLQYYKNNYQEVIELTKDISNENFLSIHAMALMKLNKFEDAIYIYEKILIISKSASNIYNLAAAYSNLTSENDLMKSIEYADNCLELIPAYHQAFYCKSLSYKKLGMHDRSLDSINYALMIDESNTEYLVAKAELLYFKGDYTEAIKLLDKVIRIDSSYQRAYRLKGIILMQNNNLISSEEFLTQSIKIDSTDQRAIAYYSLNKLAQGKINEVEEFLQTGGFVKEFQLNPGNEYSSLSEFNADLANDVRQHSLLRKEPNGLAARNGYLTDDLFRDETRAILLFKKLLLEKIKLYIEELPDDKKHYMLRHKTLDFTMNSWATWVKGDGFIDKHIHEKSWISGAYYCTVPEITNNTDSYQGYFEYGCCPDDLKINIDKKSGYIKPVEGKLIIFPSYLYHQTIKHSTNDDRISIAFDLTPKNWQ